MYLATRKWAWDLIKKKLKVFCSLKILILYLQPELKETNKEK
ncbi:hypothetical protein GGQ60_001936 [Pedobacter zeae]|uniref:Uncharacterized protein n=1 Tax=Pedobacter zeae TaxID=1737356 RepID=A0A7W6KA09_9SPHI|nr:hypothetical protein [Pedobacter zeae]